jgi:membrane associated rhomboid family serine protease
MLVIFVNIVVFMLQSTPGGEEVPAYYIIETASVLIFTVEYLLRLWSIVESKVRVCV